MVSVNFSIHNLEFFLLILARISSVLFVAPIYSVRGVPIKAKVGISFFISLLVINVVPYHDLQYSTMLGYTILVLKEVIVGLLLGFSANMATYIISFAGKIIDIDIGFSMVQLFDNTTNQLGSAFGNFYNYLFLLMMLITDMHHYVIQAVVDSYQLFSVDEAIFKGQYMYQSFLTYMADYFTIGFRMVLPVFATMLLLNVVLGILAKAAPQMNMFVVGIQLKIFLGLGVIIVTILCLPMVSDFIFDEMRKMIKLFVRGFY